MGVSHGGRSQFVNLWLPLAQCNDYLPQMFEKIRMLKLGWRIKWCYGDNYSGFVQKCYQRRYNRFKSIRMYWFWCCPADKCHFALRWCRSSWDYLDVLECVNQQELALGKRRNRFSLWSWCHQWRHLFQALYTLSGLFRLRWWVERCIYWCDWMLQCNHQRGIDLQSRQRHWLFRSGGYWGCKSGNRTRSSCPRGEKERRRSGPASSECNSG